MAKKQFKFNEIFFEFVNGNIEKFKRKWMDVEYVYYIVNVNDNHWFLCQIYLISWVIVAYDSDVEKLMEPISNLLPYILLQAGFSPTQYIDLEGSQPFQYRREPPL